MSAAADARGLKRVCAGCGSRYYDFNKRPVKCPSCAVEFSAEIKLKTRRGRTALADVVEAKPAANDENIEQVEATENTISLEEVEEGGKDDADEDGIDLDGEEIEDIEVISDDDLEEEDLEVKIEKE